MNLSSMIKSMEATSSRGPPLEVDELKDGICIINSAGIMMTTNVVRGVVQLMLLDSFLTRVQFIVPRGQVSALSFVTLHSVDVNGNGTVIIRDLRTGISIINSAGIMMTHASHPTWCVHAMHLLCLTSQPATHPALQQYLAVAELLCACGVL
jgi:hypothetical protein